MNFILQAVGNFGTNKNTVGLRKKLCKSITCVIKGLLCARGRIGFNPGDRKMKLSPKGEPGEHSKSRDRRVAGTEGRK